MSPKDYVKIKVLLDAKSTYALRISLYFDIIIISMLAKFIIMEKNLKENRNFLPAYIKLLSLMDKTTPSNPKQNWFNVKQPP